MKLVTSIPVVLVIAALCAGCAQAPNSARGGLGVGALFDSAQVDSKQAAPAVSPAPTSTPAVSQTVAVLSSRKSPNATPESVFDGCDSVLEDTSYIFSSLSVKKKTADFTFLSDPGQAAIDAVTRRFEDAGLDYTLTFEVHPDAQVVPF